MEKKNEGTGEGKCGSCGSCGSCCWGKVAVGLFLFLIGFLMGLSMGRCGRGYMGGGCPIAGMICPVSGATSAPAK